jgi:hypothetical protein
MDLARDHLLARARLPQQKDGDVRGGEQFDPIDDGPKASGQTDQSAPTRAEFAPEVIRVRRWLGRHVSLPVAPDSPAFDVVVNSSSSQML